MKDRARMTPMRPARWALVNAVLGGALVVGLAGCESEPEPFEPAEEAREEFSASFEDFKDDFEDDDPAEEVGEATAE